MGRKGQICGAASAVLGLVLLAVGVSVKWAIFPKLLEDQVYANILLENGTEGYDAFVSPPVPVYMKFYFFSVTNPDEVSNGAKPVLQEIGPYAYKEERGKENILEVYGDKLYYASRISYSFDADMSEKSNCTNGRDSKCSDKDTMVVLNGALAGVAALAGPALESLQLEDGDKKLIYDIINLLLKTGKFKEELFKEVTVAELAFDGYETGLLNVLGDLDTVVIEVVVILTDGALRPATVDEGLDTLQSLLDVLKPDITINVKELYYELKATVTELVDNTPQISGGRFGIFKGRNATKADSYYAINTGRHERHNFMKILEFNGRERLPDEWWPNVAPTPTGQAAGVDGICHDILGTDGSQFPPFVDKAQRLWIYVGELCRSLWLDFEAEVELEGIPLYRFRPAKDVFAMDNPNNYCYCPEFHECASVMEGRDEWNRTECENLCKDGMLKVGTCYGGAPIVMTQPHFLQAHPSLLDAVEGLHPSTEAHDTYLDIEPTSGAAFVAHKRIQINMPLARFENLELVSKVPNLVFPVLWADETAELDSANAEDFKSMVLQPQKIVDGVAIGVGVVLGAVLFVVGVFLMFFKRRGSSYKA